MIPIRELLNRIRWDEEFGRASFEIGYLDHVVGKIVRIGFKEMIFSESSGFSFQWEDEVGAVHTIPYHRIREVYRDGRLIWERPR